MKNSKGFTLTEVLLAVMIVGLVGVALAALTGTAVRESNVGRTRLMLRNQLSVAMRQLRQDVHLSSGGSAGGGSLTLSQDHKIGPTHQTESVQYVYTTDSNGNGMITRNGEPWISNVKTGTSSFQSPEFKFLHYGKSQPGLQTPPVNSVLRLRLVVGMNSEPPVTEIIEETIMLPHGFSISHQYN